MNVALRPQHLDILSICTGGGGLDLGIGLAVPGSRSVCLVEREAFAVAQLVSAMRQGLLHPAPVWSDARTFNGRRWRGCVDGLIGGIPCQPHSLAGKREGSDDERDLWSDARRIIVQCRPWFVLIENVEGMLSAKPGLDPGALRVRRDLQRLGFDIAGGLFTAAEVGASHERERVFILAVADNDGRVEQQGRGQGSPRHRQPELGSADGGLVVADADDTRPQGRRNGNGEVGWQGPERHAGLGGGELAVANGGGQSCVGIGNGGRSGDARGLRARRDADGCDSAVADAERDGRGARDERYLGARQEGGAALATASGGSMGDTIGSGYDGRTDDAIGRSVERTSPEGPSGRSGGVHRQQHMADAYRNESPQERRDDREMQGSEEGEGGPEHSSAISGGRGDPSGIAHIGIFPPGPGDLPSWSSVLASAPELEPAFRRVADGLASRLDVARVDRLRMLGNGVVPLQAAYAFRTLSNRLAGRGSAGATRLVRMMGDQP